MTDWELKGVPVRVEVGPRDLARGVVTLCGVTQASEPRCPLPRSGPGSPRPSTRPSATCSRGPGPSSRTASPTPTASTDAVCGREDRFRPDTAPGFWANDGEKELADRERHGPLPGHADGGLPDRPRRRGRGRLVGIDLGAFLCVSLRLVARARLPRLTSSTRSASWLASPRDLEQRGAVRFGLLRPRPCRQPRAAPRSLCHEALGFFDEGGDHVASGTTLTISPLMNR